MKRVFEVKIMFFDGSRSGYNVAALNDAEARDQAVKIDRKSWKDFGDSAVKVPDIDYCEIRYICDLD